MQINFTHEPIPPVRYRALGTTTLLCRSASYGPCHRRKWKLRKNSVLRHFGSAVRSHGGSPKQLRGSFQPVPLGRGKCKGEYHGRLRICFMGLGIELGRVSFRNSDGTDPVWKQTDLGGQWLWCGAAPSRATRSTLVKLSTSAADSRLGVRAVQL